MSRGTIRYWAAAKQAAGAAEEPFDAGTLAAALADAAARRPGDRRFAELLERSSLLVDGAPVGRRAAADVPLADGSVIEVLPPFAGG
jgi:molybdopterin converting factor small subunit